MVAIALAVATIVVSCKGEKEGEYIDWDNVPKQIIENMSANQTENGLLQMRMESGLMQSFNTKETNESYELFSNGFNVYAYNQEGLLETHISSAGAKHTKKKEEEVWEAFGNVVIKNFLKGQRMETDTIYWDRENKKIFTHCFVKMYDPKGFMQGYGMESDEMARNAIINNVFDNFVVIDNDSTKFYVDSVNFIGPFKSI